MTEVPAPSQPDDYDSPWKEALERFFPPFLAFFFPAAHADIDWQHGYEFLDTELQQVVRDAALGRRLVDKLVRVWRRSGEEAWVLVHIEVQGQVDPEFARRMYVYNYRLFDRFDHPVASLGVLGDNHPEWRPDQFGYELWGCRPGLRFPVVKLREYEARWAELEGSANPFAVLVMAHLKTQATQRDPERRLAWKLRLVRGLYERGYGREEVLELFRVIDWMMALPAELAEGFAAALREYEEERAMPYVTSIERQGIAQGIAQGIQQGIAQGIEQGIAQGLQQGIGQGLQQGIGQGEVTGLREAVLVSLSSRFEPVPEAVRAGVAVVDGADALKELVRRAATAASLEEFAQHLPAPE